MNALLTAIENNQNRTLTENGAATLKSSLKHTVDFFGLGGALRSRSDQEVISLFSKAFAEDALTAVKILFYLRDAREGQGERKIFRTCLNWLAREYPQVVIKNSKNIIEFGRWDDLYCIRGTMLWKALVLPMFEVEWEKEGTSLMWKWIASENTSSKETRSIATDIRTFIGVSSREYRKTISAKRAQLDVVERKMCANNWSQINYKAVPSKAALNYRNAFKKHDQDRYTKFIADVKTGKTTINAGVLYPYDIVSKCFKNDESSTLDVLWSSLPDYMLGDDSNGIVVADVSGSMAGRPMEASVSLAMYIAERNKGAFNNTFITFSENPSLQKIIGNNVREKVSNLSQADWGMSTNLESVFDLVLKTAKEHQVPSTDLPSKIYIVSDMEFNRACSSPDSTLFEAIDQKYKNAGYERPELVFWNVNARNNQSPVRYDERGTCLVSGCSPVILTSLLSGKIVSAEDVMFNAVNVERYNVVTV